MVEVNPATDEFRCPVCGTINDVSSLQCKKCMTPFQRKDGDASATLEVRPFKVNVVKEVTIDDASEMSEAEARAVEELTNIPGIDKNRARQLYALGITNLAALIEKTVTFGEKGKGMSKLLANRIMLQRIGETYAEEEEKGGRCPFCKAEIPGDSTKCPVCGKNLQDQVVSYDLDSVMLDVSDYVGDIFDQLSGDQNFIQMPDDLKAQVSDLLKEGDLDDLSDEELLASLGEDGEDDEDFGMSDEELGIDEASLAEIAADEAGAEQVAGAGPEAVEAEAKPEPEAAPEPGPEAKPAPTPEPEVKPEPEVAPEPKPEAEKVQGVKIEVNAEPEVAPAEEPVPEPEAEEVVEGGAEGGEKAQPKRAPKKKLKKKAKKKSPMDMEREKCRMKVHAWREKGFDPKELDELEDLVDSDLKEFKQRSIAMLKARLEQISSKKKVKKIAEESLQCPKCQVLNHVSAKECNGCGVKFASG